MDERNAIQMIIRKAAANDIEGIMKLLFQINKIHADNRPDLFIANGVKYQEHDLLEIFKDPDRPVFVAVDEHGFVMGYVFGIFEITKESSCQHPVKTFYIDDLCVDVSYRGQHIGTALYKYTLDIARQMGCYRVTLHVWNFNQDAFEFYEKLGMTPLVTTMEQVVN